MSINICKGATTLCQVGEEGNMCKGLGAGENVRRTAGLPDEGQGQRTGEYEKKILAWLPFDLTSDQLEAPNWTWRGKGFCWEITLPYVVSKFLMDLTDQLN